MLFEKSTNNPQNPHSLTDRQTTLRILIWGFRLVTPKSVLPPLLALLGAWPLQNLQLLWVCVSLTRLLYHDMWIGCFEIMWKWNNMKCVKWWKKLKKKHGKKKPYHVTRVSTAFTIWRPFRSRAVGFLHLFLFAAFFQDQGRFNLKILYQRSNCTRHSNYDRDGPSFLTITEAATPSWYLDSILLMSS